MKTYSKAQLQAKAASIFNRFADDDKLLATADGNIFRTNSESAARHHAKVRNLKVIELDRPEGSEKVLSITGQGKVGKSEAGKSETVKYEDMKRPALDAELTKRDLNPDDYSNKAACVAALEADDLARAEKAAAEKAAAESEAPATEGPTGDNQEE